MTTAACVSGDVPTPLGWLDHLARRVLTGQLAALSRGTVLIRDRGGELALGQPADLRAELRVHHPRFFRQAILGGTLSVAESYVRGDWDCDGLTDLFRIVVRNRDTLSGLDGGLARLARFAHRLVHRWRDNSRRRSCLNIAAHYDLGNDFYRIWLDDTLAYSSGIFPTPATTLQQASVEKFDRVCRRLRLAATDRLLEIGTGWGGFALHAAQHHGCHVTTTTLSQYQYQLARQRIEAAGLADRVSLLKLDYRDLHGTFDKLVAIEMIEAVGHRHLDHFFAQCGNLLQPRGSLVLQAIVMPERGYEQYLQSVDFIQRYIFPGGCLPSLAAMLTSVGRKTDLRFVEAEDFAGHYAETLRRWRESFETRLDDVRCLGYTEEFIRLWRYYLCYCEAAFAERAIGLLQITFDGPECRRDAL